MSGKERKIPIQKSMLGKVKKFPHKIDVGKGEKFRTKIKVGMKAQVFRH